MANCIRDFVMLREVTLFGLIALSVCYQWGRFDILENVVINPTTAYCQKMVTCACSCRRLCFEDAECYFFSVEMSNFRYVCGLFNQCSQNNTLRPSSTGIIGGPFIPGASIEADGLYYFIANRMALKVQSISDSFCNSTLGFRWALIKTVTAFQISIRYYNSVTPRVTVINLHKNTDNKTATYGDGTLYADSELAKSGQQLTMNMWYFPAVFSLYNGLLKDQDNGLAPYSVLCQGNLLGIQQ